MCICKVCGHENKGTELEVPEMMYGTGERFTYFRCLNCDCLQLENIPDDIGKYYSNQYYSFAERDGSQREIKKQQEECCILDVGCGSGEFLCELANEGYTNLVGCDPFINTDIEYENGVHIFKKSIHEMDGKYDLIFLNDSFEHVEDPHEVMDSIYRLLNDNGFARIQMPIFPNIAYELYKEHWYQIDAPRHIVVYSVKGLNHIANMHNMEVVDSRWNSDYSQFVRSFLCQNGHPFNEHSMELIHKYFSDSDLAEINNTVNIANQNKVGDHALFVLKRKLM